MKRYRDYKGALQPRKINNRWVHSSFGVHTHISMGNPGEKTTVCGKTTRRARAVFDKNKVDCPRCIEKLKENNWYCEEHGFIQDVDVRNDETCDYCGREVRAK